MVERAVAEQRNGKPAQLVTVRFARAGTKTLSTAFADLCAADDPSLSLAPPETDEEAQAEAATIEELRERLKTLPEACTDPFRTLKQRLRATLNEYAHRAQGAPLLDWAAARTRLRDPLTYFSRHELEAALEAYARIRDRHALGLVRQLAKESPDDLREIGTGASPDELTILRGLVARR